jgi:hypothetical protein
MSLRCSSKACAFSVSLSIICGMEIQSLSDIWMDVCWKRWSNLSVIFKDSWVKTGHEGYKRIVRMIWSHTSSNVAFFKFWRIDFSESWWPFYDWSDCWSCIQAIHESSTFHLIGWNSRISAASLSCDRACFAWRLIRLSQDPETTFSIRNEGHIWLDFENLLLDEYDCIRITDFGFAPEVIRGGSYDSREADIGVWMWICILYWALEFCLKNSR